MPPSAFQVPEPGALIAGKYRVNRVLASGGMGVVLDAEHAALGQRVAIKFLLPEAGQRAELVERFLREARAAARLTSDHVVRVFDIGTDEAGVPFMVMELLAGSDLGDELEARGPLPVGDAVRYIVEALDAIVEAHAAGIVHRDLKPSNLFVVAKPDGTRRVKVLDFGISKVSMDRSKPEVALTSTTSMLGSPGYMSPEQVRSTKSVDARTDVWALGVILYELLTGASAFTGETLGDVFAKIREEDLPPVRSLRPEVPEALEAVLMQCLRRDREKRMPDAAAMRRALAPFAAGVQPGEGPSSIAVSRVVAQAATMGTAVSGGGLATQETLATWSGGGGTKRRGALVVGGTLAVSVAALGVWLLVGRDGAARGPTLSHDEPAHSATAEAPPPASAPVVTPSEPVTATATAATVTAAAPSASAPVANAGGAKTGHGGVAPRPTVTSAPPPPAPPPAPTKKKKEELGI